MSENPSHRFQRLLAILKEVQDTPGQSASDLAEKFGTSKRNLFRDIKLLQESGFAIESEAGGYRVDQPKPSRGKKSSSASGPVAVLQQGLHPWNVNAAATVPMEIKVEPALAEQLRQNPLHPTQTIRGNKLTIEVSGADRVVDWLMSVQGAELLEPSWLRGTIARRAQAVADLYN